MTIKEMHENVLRRYYESAIKVAELKDSEEDRMNVLREAVNAFGFAAVRLYPKED